MRRCRCDTGYLWWVFEPENVSPPPLAGFHRYSHPLEKQYQRLHSLLLGLHHSEHRDAPTLLKLVEKLPGVPKPDPRASSFWGGHHKRRSGVHPLRHEYTKTHETKESAAEALP